MRLFKYRTGKPTHKLIRAEAFKRFNSLGDIVMIKTKDGSFYEMEGDDEILELKDGEELWGYYSEEEYKRPIGLSPIRWSDGTSCSGTIKVLGETIFWSVTLRDFFKGSLNMILKFWSASTEAGKEAFSLGVSSVDTSVDEGMHDIDAHIFKGKRAGQPENPYAELNQRILRKAWEALEEELPGVKPQFVWDNKK